MTSASLPSHLARLVGTDAADLRLDSPRPLGEAHEAFVLPQTPELSRVLDPAAAAGPPVPLPVPGAPFMLSRTASDPSLFVYEPGGPYTVLRGEVDPWQADPRLLLARSDEGVVSLREGGWLLDLERGHARAWLLPGEDGPRLSPQAPPQVPLLPPWPGARVFLDGLSCPPWLERRAELLGASPDPLDVLCAAGLLVRLWSPTNAEDRARALKAALGGAPILATKVRGWLSAVTDWGAMEAAILDRVADLEDALAGLLDLMGRDPALARATAGRILAQRDDLASLQAAALVGGRDRTLLARALGEVDRLAVIHGALLSDLLVLDVDDPWLLAVGRSEPEHWWGGLVR